MTEPFTRLQDISQYNVHYRPNGTRKPALWDCPKVIREAANGRPPELVLVSAGEMLRWGWWLLLGIGLFVGLILFFMAGGIGLPMAWRIGILVVVPLGFLTGVPWAVAVANHQEYAGNKELFDAYAANPELYRDEIYKAAVYRLPVLDFFGRHRLVQDASIGRYEAEVIEAFRKLGIRQEATVANRGRPFLIHQYELTELGWGKWEDGGTKNYTLDIAILWPERRIKFDIEIDDPSHCTGARPIKDVQRDEVLTERGWFVRRFNHNFLREGVSNGRLAEKVKDVISIVYFFAKYANDEPIDQETRLMARVRESRFREQRAKVRKQRASVVVLPSSQEAPPVPPVDNAAM